jgi:hypothetical protein
MSHYCDGSCTHESERFYRDANRGLNSIGMLLWIAFGLFCLWTACVTGSMLIAPEPGVNPISSLIITLFFACMTWGSFRVVLRRR